jgi:hypothetical protein
MVGRNRVCTGPGYLGEGVHKDVHHLQEDASSPSAKALIKLVNVRGREPLPLLAKQSG